MAAPLTPAFQRAIESFKTKCGMTANDIRELELTSLADLGRAITRIQNEQKVSGKMKHLKRLEPFLNAMNEYGKVLDVFVNVSNYVAFVWGPIKFLLITTSNHADAFNAVLDGYMRIGENIPQLVQYQQLFENNTYMQNALVSIFEDIVEFHQEAVRYFKQKTWKQLFHATWKAMATKINQLSRSLQQHKALLDGQCTILQFQEFQSLRELEKQRFESLLETERMRRRVAVQQWLGAINSETRQEDTLKRRYSKTGDWILNNRQFLQWYSFDHCADALLWLNGIPGAGKSVLASIIIQEARKLPKARVVFFYCKSTDEQRNGFVNIARSMLSQLLAINDNLLLQLYEKTSTGGEAMLTSEELAKELLETAIKSTPTTYIVIDGLDEYSRENRKEISSWFQDLVHSIPTHDFGVARCLFISQDDGYARKDFKSLSQMKITLKDTQKDIELFCKHWHQQIESKFGPLSKQEHNVTNVVTARSQGMFLYAKLVTWNLYEQTTRMDLEAELAPNILPDGLNQAYARITERLFGSATQFGVTVNRPRNNNARKLLGWLSCAKRPLLWREIQGATAIDIDEGIVSTDRRFIDDCKDLCASLVEISSDGSVNLVHSTVKFFLVEQGYVQPAEVECDLATLCVSYLGFVEFELGRPAHEIQGALLNGYYAFADYAICFWAIHSEWAISKYEQYDKARFDLLTEYLDVFLDTRYSDHSDKPNVSKTLEENLSALSSHHCFNKACLAIAATKNHLRPTGKEPQADDILQIYKANRQIRAILEEFASSGNLDPSNKSLLTDSYGANWFKCPRLNCQFFHAGFATEEQRKAHVSKHERAFTCPQYGCPQSIIGCTSAKTLEKHILDCHGLGSVDQEPEFPDVDLEENKTMDPVIQSQQLRPRRVRKTSWECDLCSKKFTRSHNLKNHMRSHKDDRRHECGICGKTFVRLHDLNRHELLHLNLDPIVCDGELPDGRRWGCCKGFARNDKLIRHLKSEAGRACLEPLWEPIGQPHDDGTSTPQTFANFSLPAAFLEKYPALATIQRVNQTPTAVTSSASNINSSGGQTPV